MTLKKKISSVNAVFNKLNKFINRVKEKTGLECIYNCVECCFKNNVEATILEFLPLAYDLYINKKAEQTLEMIAHGTVNKPCVFLNTIASPTEKKGCSVYEKRGLICRLFGFSAMRNKSGDLIFLTCKIIKENFKSEFEKAQKLLKTSKTIPVMRDYYMMLYNVDLNLASKYYPINEAVKRAIECILFYYQFRGKSAG